MNYALGPVCANPFGDYCFMITRFFRLKCALILALAALVPSYGFSQTRLLTDEDPTPGEEVFCDCETDNYGLGGGQYVSCYGQELISGCPWTSTNGQCGSTCTVTAITEISCVSYRNGWPPKRLGTVPAGSTDTGTCVRDP